MLDTFTHIFLNPIKLGLFFEIIEICFELVGQSVVLCLPLDWVLDVSGIDQVSIVFGEVVSVGFLGGEGVVGATCRHFYDLF